MRVSKWWAWRFSFWLGMVLCPLTCQGQSAPAPAKPESAETAPQPPADDKRTELNLLGKTDVQAGESRRNENIQFNLIDNNALKELNARLGTSATVTSEFLPEFRYYGSEFGNKPSPSVHLDATRILRDFHLGLSFTHSNSIFSARSFFQVGDVKPARENNYGVAAGVGLWRGAHLGLSGSGQKLRGSINGNVLVPLASERTPLTTDPAATRLIQWLKRSRSKTLKPGFRSWSGPQKRRRNESRSR